MLDANRLFPAETYRPRRSRQAVRHGPRSAHHFAARPHRSALVCGEQALPNPAALFIQPDHYIFRMLYSQGVSLESLGIPQVDGKESADPREVWRIFARHYYLFRGTPTRLWLDYAFRAVFGLTDRLSVANADEYYEIDCAKLETPEFLPRALFERFNIEVLATTDAAVDSLEYHQAIKASGWKGRVLPTFRPDAVVDAEYSGFQDNLKTLGEVSGRTFRRGRVTWLRCARGGRSSRRMARRRPTTGT
jgi:glucuronate isomerase